MVPREHPELSLGGGMCVPLDQVDRILFSGVVVLKGGERLVVGRSFISLVRDWNRLGRLSISRELGLTGATHPEALEPLSTAEAAELSGYSVRRLRLLIRAKKIRATKVSGRWAIGPGSLYLWVAEHT